VLHVVYSFSIGGLENVIVQLINRLPADRFEHVVMSLTTISDFKDRVTQPGVRFIALEKPPGHAVPLYPRIYKLLRELRPDVLHTCNFASLELVPLGWLARVPLRLHAEHGWDSHDRNGKNLRHQRVRRFYRPFVGHYVGVSKEIDQYLANAIHVPSASRSLIANGVDTEQFAPAPGLRQPVPGCPFEPGKHWLMGTVGRLQTVKNQPLLVRAFVRFIQQRPQAAERVRLVIVGEGPLRVEVESILAAAGLQHLAWLPGPRNDVPDVLRMLDVFVLPSQAEGTSCTLQEAMASGLPVVATAVGGNPQLVQEGQTGLLVPSEDEAALADALASLWDAPEQARAMGAAGREIAVRQHGLEAMVSAYAALLGPRP
jgi:sugar transferase (PEP-CTERM/EpsH1 system associated)